MKAAEERFLRFLIRFFFFMFALAKENSICQIERQKMLCCRYLHLFTCSLQNKTLLHSFFDLFFNTINNIFLKKKATRLRFPVLLVPPL